MTNEEHETHLNFDYADDDHTAALERWIPESVWVTRDEAVRHAKTTEHNYAYGWRVYCLSACGELAEILANSEIASVGGVG